MIPLWNWTRSKVYTQLEMSEKPVVPSPCILDPENHMFVACFVVIIHEGCLALAKLSLFLGFDVTD